MTWNRAAQMTLDPVAPPAAPVAPPVAPPVAQRAVAAAAAAGAVLPCVEPLTPGEPAVGHAGLAATLAQAGLAGAAVADLSGPAGGTLAVLVGVDLVNALSNSPLHGLELAAAVQPALDAAASALGGRAGTARTVGLDLVVHDLGGPFTAVPLSGSGADISAAVLITDGCLAPATGGARLTSTSPSPTLPPRGIEMLHGVILDVTVELGRTRMSVRDLLALAPGTVLELDRAAGSPADLLVNGRIVARGEVVVVDEDFGLRVTEIVHEPTAY